VSRFIPASRLIRILAIVAALFACVVMVTAVASDAGPRRSPKPDAEEHEDVVKHAGALTGSCGVERWSVKTGTDADAGSISLQSTTQTTIASLDAIPAPSNLPANNRVKPTETTVYQLHATLTQYKLEADSDYHLVLSDGAGHTMIGEIPDPTCVGSGSPLLSSIQKARSGFDAKYTATGSFKTANVPVTITGVGFFDFDHGQTGVAPNAIELHAVLDLQFGSGNGGTVTVTNPGNQTGTIGTAVSLPISATDTAAGTLSYRATSLPAGLSISSSSGRISGTPTTAGTSNVTVTATDTTGPSGSTSFTWTIGSTTGKQLLGNPGFETGTAAPWSTATGVISNNSSQPPHSGSWDAWLDGKGTTHTDTLSQQVTIPASANTATLSLWLHIDTAETSTTAYDTLKIQILNSAGTLLATPATYSNTDHATGYSQHTFNLAAYIGQTITLKFTGSEDYTKQTSFVLDDTALTTG
jgi:hypothetical protein